MLHGERAPKYSDIIFKFLDNVNIYICLNESAKDNLRDILIQWDQHNVPEFTTTPAVLCGGMTLFHLIVSIQYAYFVNH